MILPCFIGGYFCGNGQLWRDLILLLCTFSILFILSPKWMGAKSLSGTFFHRLSASTESNGAWKASSAIFFHRLEAYLHPDGLKNLILAHFSISQKLNSNLMDWKKLLFQGCSITGRHFSASMVKQGKWIPSTRKLSKYGWKEKPGGSPSKQWFPSTQK